MPSRSGSPNILGPTADTPLTSSYFSLPALPTVLGYDPRLQFAHEDDVIDVLRIASNEPARGTLNSGAMAAGAAVVGGAAAARMGCRGAAGSGRGVGGRRSGALPSSVVAVAPGGGAGEEGLQRGDFFVYGVEDGRHLLTHVTELYGKPVAERAPGIAV
ncbi:hypothetical protein SALBM311S_05190 [Streptomyces alboniger]